MLFREWNAKQPKLGILLPKLRAVALRLLHISKALRKIAIAVEEQAIHAVLELALLIVEIKIHHHPPGGFRLLRTLRAADARRGQAGTDQEAAADAIEYANGARILEEAPRPRCNQSVPNRIGKGEAEKSRLEDEHLAPEAAAWIEELRQERHKEGDALWVQRGDEPGMAQHVARWRVLVAGVNI